MAAAFRGRTRMSKAICMMEIGRLLRACLVTLALLAAAVSARPALAQANFDRPGGDYLSAPVTSGDPADCALVCERDRRCRAWTFNYPTDIARRRGVLAEEQRAGARAEQLLRLRRARRRRGRAAQRARSKPRSTASAATTGISISRASEGDDACKAACAADNKCRAWTYARPGYAGKEAALLPEERHQAAAAQGRVYFGRGAVTIRALRRNCMRTRERFVPAERIWLRTSSGRNSR